jgi:diguanylate cyclase (GGDEF)-like protein
MMRFSLRLQITVLWVLVNLVVATLVGYLLYSTSGRLFKENFLASKLSLAVALAGSIDGDVHARFISEEASKDPEYQRYLAFLHRIKTREKFITYLYTLSKDPEKDELHYTVDADIGTADTLWLQTEYFALWFFWKDGRLICGYQEEEHNDGFSVEVRKGVTVPMQMGDEEGVTVVRLGDLELFRIFQRQPLMAATPAGPVDEAHRELLWEPELSGQPAQVTFSFSKAGESLSMPGSAYVDTPENVDRLLGLLREDRDLVEREAERDTYGLSLSAYGIIHNHAGRPAGLVAMDFYQKELDAFEGSLRRTVLLLSAITFAIVLAVSLLVAQYLLVPLHRITAAVHSVSEGRLETRLPIQRRDEFGVLAEGFNSMVESITVNLSRRQAAEAELSRLAYFDQLTGLPNRESFHDRLEECLALAKRSEFEKLRALLFLDLDRFKDVNDNLGHQIGDRVLQEAAKRIRQTLRQSDLVFRQGGDEFTVLLPNLRVETDAALVAEKLVKAFVDPFVVDIHTVHVGLSVGIALYPRDGTTGNELIRAADTALFEAKRDRNNYRYYSQGMQDKAFEKFTMVNNLHQGIAKDQFILHFQPVMDIQERLAGCEALLRWSHPELGTVPPGRFIPLAEETGLIIPLGRLGIRVACRLLKRLDQLRNTSATIAVNLSAKQLRDNSLVADVDAQLAEFQTDPHRLELEITESGLMDEPTAVGRIEELRSRGIRFSIDDFGTGYSSLSRLRSLPIDTLKIDRGFIAGVPGNRQDRDLVQAVITIAHGFGQVVCAEGVETREQLEFLRQAGCDLIQGYLFSPPVPEEAFLEIVRTRPAAPSP